MSKKDDQMTHVKNAAWPSIQVTCEISDQNMPVSEVIKLDCETAVLWKKMKTILNYNIDSNLLLHFIRFYVEAHGIDLDKSEVIPQYQPKQQQKLNVEHAYSATSTADSYIIITQTQDNQDEVKSKWALPKSPDKSANESRVSVWLSGDEEDDITTDYDVTFADVTTVGCDVTVKAELEELPKQHVRKREDPDFIPFGDARILDQELDADEIHSIIQAVSEREARTQLKQLRSKESTRTSLTVRGMDGAIWRDMVFQRRTDLGISKLCWYTADSGWRCIDKQTFRWDDPTFYRADMDEQSLVKHVSCTLCGHKPFANRLEVAKHFWYNHPETRERTPTQVFSTKLFNGFAHCTLCFYINRFCDKSTGELSSHVESAHEELSVATVAWPHVCDTCSSEFATDGELDQHVVTEHVQYVPVAYTCVRCGEVNQGEQKYIRHLQWHYVEYKYACSQCPNFRSPDPDIMVGHVSHHDRRYLQCELCPQKSRIYRTIIDHVRGHVGKPRHICAICGYMANTSSRYHNHLDSHGIRKHKCNICDAEFSSLRAKAKHKLIQHRKPASATCEKCNRVFTSRHRLERHKAKHTGYKAFQCYQCDRRLSSKSSLMSHMANTCPALEYDDPFYRSRE